MSSHKRKPSSERTPDESSTKHKRRKRFNDDDDDEDAVENRDVDVVPPLRSSQNLWAPATVGKDTAVKPTGKDRKFAEGENTTEQPPLYLELECLPSSPIETLVITGWFFF